MQRQSVKSSNLASVGYDALTSTLEVEFHGGHVYRFRGVPEHAHKALVQAKSIGRAFAQNIRPVYSGQLLRPEPRKDAEAVKAPAAPAQPVKQGRVIFMGRVVKDPQP
jgi:hypothetical protein